MCIIPPTTDNIRPTLLHLHDPYVRFSMDLLGFPFHIMANLRDKEAFFMITFHGSHCNHLHSWTKLVTIIPLAMEGKEGSLANLAKLT